MIQIILKFTFLSQIFPDQQHGNLVIHQLFSTQYLFQLNNSATQQLSNSVTQQLSNSVTQQLKNFYNPMEENKLTYKEAMAEIEDIVTKLENNQLDVDELSGKVKRVSELIAFCKSKLHETEEEVEKILKTIED